MEPSSDPLPGPERQSRRDTGPGPLRFTVWLNLVVTVAWGGLFIVSAVAGVRGWRLVASAVVALLWALTTWLHLTRYRAARSVGRLLR